MNALPQDAGHALRLLARQPAFAARTLRALLFGVTAADPITFAVVVLALGGAAPSASYLPARQAARVHPIVELRAE